MTMRMVQIPPLKTRLQLNVSKLGTFDALRVTTEDHLRSRRIFKTTSAGNTQEDDPMEVDVLSRKGKIRQGQERWKGKECHNGKGRNCRKHGHKAADCWYKQQHKPQGKRKGTGKSKSNVTEISESDTSKQVEETWSPNTCIRPVYRK